MTLKISHRSAGDRGIPKPTNHRFLFTLIFYKLTLQTSSYATGSKHYTQATHGVRLINAWNFYYTTAANSRNYWNYWALAHWNVFLGVCMTPVQNITHETHAAYRLTSPSLWNYSRLGFSYGSIFYQPAAHRLFLWPSLLTPWKHWRQTMKQAFSILHTVYITVSPN